MITQRKNGINSPQDILERRPLLSSNTRPSGMTSTTGYFDLGETLTEIRLPAFSPMVLGDNAPMRNEKRGRVLAEVVQRPGDGRSGLYLEG